MIYTDISHLPLNKHETYLKEGFGGLCTSGTAVIEIFSVSHRISPNDIVTVLPLQLASIREISDDFSMIFFKFDKVLFIDIMSSLGKITPDFFFYMRKNFRYHLTNGEAQRFLSFCDIIRFRNSSDDPAFRDETILHLLRIYFWDFYVSFLKANNNDNNSFTNSNKENIAIKFAMLVAEHYRNHREISFYAAELCISPAYLTKVIQEMNGQSPHELIADYVIIEIKKLLRNPLIDLKNVTQQTNFASQSSLSRFFRQQTGMSPSEYRRRIHAIR
ncbi:AraC-type DNA-binding protein [Bacteroides faecichinchillae]|uniref:AraC-type DNA-binding protein n=1 Tax=Bacteroides faecichinchillae TaxID=871325 RepID=A0A1M4SCJ5_9BACE|nr:AraC family transcriptional regulator [Bacteroides faecichinchillae]THG67175.1 helix-turn-helix transcriptional regulator [Bacteroides faecichinchillae]SHE29919.1 AraC-type DNA-binding protein [Bacteroides faecichinchillae]